MENRQHQRTECPLHHDRDAMEQCIIALLEKDRLNHLGGFIQGLIHNINGPLQNMSMLVEVLIRGQGQMEVHDANGLVLQGRQMDALIQKQGKRLEQLNQQISVLADMLRSFMALHEVERNETEIDVNLVLTKLSEVFRADLFYKHQVTLDLQLTKNLPLVRVFGRHFIPALVHLFKNAIFAMKNSHEKMFTIESMLEDGKIRILLRDTGCGLPSGKSAERCFELFYSDWQFGPLSQRGFEPHLGFGLYAARRLLEPYGIGVSLTSVEGRTTATVEIPVPPKVQGETDR